MECQISPDAYDIYMADGVRAASKEKLVRVVEHLTGKPHQAAVKAASMTELYSKQSAQHPWVAVLKKHGARLHCAETCRHGNGCVFRQPSGNDVGMVVRVRHFFNFFFDFFPVFRGSSGASFHADQRGAFCFPKKTIFVPPNAIF